MWIKSTTGRYVNLDNVAHMSPVDDRGWVSLYSGAGLHLGEWDVVLGDTWASPSPLVLHLRSNAHNKVRLVDKTDNLNWR
jgi:hypothetical protein